MTSMPDLPDFTMDTSVTGINIAIPQLLSVGKNQPVMPLYRVEPRYPVRALQRKIEGYVKLSFTIDEQGKPTDIRVIEEQPPRIFSREAITALKRWKYSPRLVEGVAKSREGQTVKLEFRIQP
jgi:protein TonB